MWFMNPRDGCSIAPEGGGLTLGLCLPCWVCASCTFAVSLSLEVLTAGPACKLDIALHVVPGYFNARWN